MVTSNKFTTTIQECDDTQDIFIEIPPYFIEKLGWEEGTEIEWQIDQESITISKVHNTNSTQEESSKINNWYTIKEEYIQDYLNSESEGREYYDDYIQATNEETFGAEGIEFP